MEATPQVAQRNPDARYFSLPVSRSNIPLNWNTTQENPFDRNTITQDIKQHYPPDTKTKGKTNSWPSTVLDDSESVTTIISTELINQVITNLLKENEALKNDLDIQ